MKLSLEQKDKEDIVREICNFMKPLLKSLDKNISKKVLTVKELAQHLQVSEKWIYKRTYLKEIPHYKIEGQLRFKKQDIEAWLESYKINPIPYSNTVLRAIKR